MDEDAGFLGEANQESLSDRVTLVNTSLDFALITV